MKECIDAYGGLVWSLARRLLASAADAEDAVQEVFIELWECADRFDPAVGSEVTFVAMIARRRLIDAGRKRQRQRRLIDEAKTRTETAPKPDEKHESEASEEAHLAVEAIERLSPDQQRVLRLAIHYGMTHERIADHTGLPLGTVKTHVRRGLMRVRDALRPGESSEAIGATS